MKKIVALMLALMLCLSMTAMAEVPSKTASDAVDVIAVTENEPEAGAPALDVKLVSDLDMTEEELAQYEALEKIADAEVEKIKEAESVEAYFADAKDAEGNAADLKSIVGTDGELAVYELYGLVASNYDAELGKVTACLQLPTPYAEGEKVAVMIGLINKGENDEYTVDWTALPGTVENIESTTEGVETVSAVKVEIEPELMTAIQNGDAIVAVVSKAVSE